MRFRHGELYGIEACGGGVSEPSETLVFLSFVKSRILFAPNLAVI
jgi:hypothetical protein